MGRGRKQINVNDFLEEHRTEVEAQEPGTEARLFNEFDSNIHKISPTTFHTKIRQFRK
jgi:hypothetical protein